MKRIMFTVLSLLVMASITAGIAWAQNPSFNKLSATTTGNTLTVNFKLTGLGNATTVDVTLSDEFDFTCTSRGKSGTQTTSAHQTINQTTTFSVGPKPGTSSGTVSFEATCPGSQTASGAIFRNVSISATASTGSAGPVAITGPSGEILV